MAADVDFEGLAVGVVSTIISKTGYLVPYIPTKDKGPSFDGCVIVFGHKGSNHEKGDIEGRVDVQVKGYELKAPEISKNSYQIDVSDLRNFLSAGGAMLLVVTFDSQGENEQVYYARLLPFELKRILKDCKENQQTKSVSLVRLPESKEEVTDIFANFVRNYKLQRAYIDSTFEIDGSKVIKEDFKELSFGYTSVQYQSINKYDLPFDYLFSHGTYLYVNLGHNIQMPIEYIEKISVIFREQPGRVMAGDKLFYEKYKQVYLPDHEELQIGNSHRLIFDPDNKTLKYKYTLKGSLRERIVDEKFFVALLENKSIDIIGHRIPFELKDEAGSIPDIEQTKKHIEWLEKVDQALRLSHVNEDLICESLSDKEEKNIKLLVSGIIEKKQVSLTQEESTFGTIDFGNQKVMVCALRRNDNGKFDLFGYYDAPIIFKGIMTDKTEFDSSYFLMLTKNEMLKATNIDLPEIIKRLKKVTVTVDYINHVTLFLLELIKVYDEIRNEEYYQNAMELCGWLNGKDPNKSNPVHFINKCQLLKRKDLLTDKENKRLKRIADESEDLSVKTGALILLDKTEEAMQVYSLLDKSVRESFADYPICRFCPDIAS